MTQPLSRHHAAPLPAHPPGALLRCNSDLVGVLVTHDGRHLIAIRPIVAGETLFTIVGRESPTPTRYSVQVGAAMHVDRDGAHDINDVVFRFFFCYLDHACDPTTCIRDRAVIAIRDIPQGDRVTFNYNTTEYDMAEPFRCHCGSAQCVGTVRGARHLSAEQRARLLPWLSPWLSPWLADDLR